MKGRKHTLEGEADNTKPQNSFSMDIANNVTDYANATDRCNLELLSDASYGMKTHTLDLNNNENSLTSNTKSAEKGSSVPEKMQQREQSWKDLLKEEVRKKCKTQSSREQQLDTDIQNHILAIERDLEALASQEKEELTLPTTTTTTTTVTTSAVAQSPSPIPSAASSKKDVANKCS